MAKLVWLILPEQNDPSDEWEPRSVFATLELAVARIKDGAEPDDVEVEVEDEDHVECVIPEREEAYRIVRLPVEEAMTTEVQRIERDRAQEQMIYPATYEFARLDRDHLARMLNGMETDPSPQMQEMAAAWRIRLAAANAHIARLIASDRGSPAWSATR
jgi:hypothetical protein